MNYIGIDIHKKYSVACVQDDAGKVIKRVRIEGNSAEGFRRCLNGDGEPARAVIEACWREPRCGNATHVELGEGL